jgi:hypothetical protein
MLVYVGQTRSAKLIARLSELGFGECTQPKEFPPRRRPWFLDNAAFSDWKAGLDFNGEAFLRALLLAMLESTPPRFVVCPDRVATGVESLAFSLEWLARSASALQDQHAPPNWYLAVQDGMTEKDVAAVASRFGGIFVGGTLPWKIATGAAWVRFAHERSIQCHVGRVGTAKRVRWAQRIGADSIDSSLPLWSQGNLAHFVNALESRQSDFGF